MRSESTSALGQPSETKPMRGGEEDKGVAVIRGEQEMPDPAGAGDALGNVGCGRAHCSRRPARRFADGTAAAEPGSGEV